VKEGKGVEAPRGGGGKNSLACQSAPIVHQGKRRRKERGDLVFEVLVGQKRGGKKAKSLLKEEECVDIVRLSHEGRGGGRRKKNRGPVFFSPRQSVRGNGKRGKGGEGRNKERERRKAPGSLWLTFHRSAWKEGKRGKKKNVPREHI